MKLYFLGFCFALAMTSFAQEAILPIPNFGTTPDIEFEQKFYRLYTGYCSFEDAAKTAAKHGGILFAPRSKAENDFIAEQFKHYVGGFFIGITRNATGQWVTPDGKKITYQNWAEKNSALLKKYIRATIKFGETDGSWIPTTPNSKASGFIVKFKQKPKSLPTPLTNSYGMALSIETPSPLIPEEKIKLSAAPVELPGTLSANVLYTKYLYPNGIFNPKLQDKNITISGLTQPVAIRKIEPHDKQWAPYQGKYLMPVLGDSIICFLDEKPDLDVNHWSIVKVKGTIKRGPQFKQLVIENASLTSSRQVKTKHRIISSKNTSYVQIFGQLNNRDNIINENIIEIKTPPENELRHCHIGDDPEGFALELYALKQTGQATNLVVSIIGVLLDPENKEGSLTRCRIAGWLSSANFKHDPKKRKTNRQPRPAEKSTAIESEN